MIFTNIGQYVPPSRNDPTEMINLDYFVKDLRFLALSTGFPVL